MKDSKPLLDEDVSMSSTSYAYHDPFDNPRKSSANRKAKRAFEIHYEYIFWTIFLVLTVWCILDRFYVNLWAMKIDFKPLSVSLDAKGIHVPTTIRIFDGYGRATGRMFLTVLGGLFWTQCKSTENVLMEHHPSWIKLGDLRTIHNRTHYILGVFFMSIPMIIHLVITFLPAMFGVPLNTGPLRPPTKVTPFIMFNPTTGSAEMFLTNDDFYRIVSSLFFFCILFPFTMANQTRKRWFTQTQWLHMAGAFMFTIDMIRRAPHAQVFNVPVVFYWVCDRLIGLFFYRTGVASIIHKEVLDDEYVILFLYVPRQKKRRGIGSGYYVTYPGLEGMFDIAHPYIAVQNHPGDPILPEWRNKDASSSEHKFYIDRSVGERKAFARRKSISQSPSELEAEEERMDVKLENEDGVAAETDDTIFFSNWNTALFVQVHKWNRGENSFGAKLMKKPLASRIKFWGPYTSEYAAITPLGQYLPPLVLIGTGSGAGPIMDFYLYFTTNKVELVNPVSCYFSSQSIGLFQFFTDLVCSKAIMNWSVNAHLTSKDDYTVEDGDDDKGTHDTHSSTRDMKLGRLSFVEVLGGAPADSKVFFCGAPALQWKVQIAAHMYKLAYYPGHRFASDGAIECQRTGTVRFTCACNKFPCCLVY